MGMKNEGGFTLIEILAGIFILGIVLTVFFQFFIFSQKTTTNNKEQLVTLNIAETVLERIVTDEVYQNEIGPGPSEFTGDSNCGTDEGCKDRYRFTVDNNQYFIKVLVGEEQDSMGIYMVTVEVHQDEITESPLSTVKGLVEL